MFIPILIALSVIAGVAGVKNLVVEDDGRSRFEVSEIIQEENNEYR